MKKHIRRWNVWRKHCTNSWMYKLLVLFNIIHSPTMAFTLLPEECNKIFEMLKEQK